MGWTSLPCRRIYREKAMELKLDGNAQNRLQSHTEDKETHKQNKVLGNQDLFAFVDRFELYFIHSKKIRWNKAEWLVLGPEKVKKLEKKARVDFDLSITAKTGNSRAVTPVVGGGGGLGVVPLYKSSMAMRCNQTVLVKTIKSRIWIKTRKRKSLPQTEIKSSRQHRGQMVFH